MNWIAESSEVARAEVSRAISVELTRAREVLEGVADLASRVHEARRAIKRTRALLKLADPRSGDSHTDRTLRDASRALALLRDADVVVVTAEDIRAGSRSSEPNLVPRHLLESLEDDRGRRFAESGSADGPLRRAHELLRSVTFEIPETQTLQVTDSQKPTPSGAVELLRVGLGASYASAQVRSDPAAGEGPVDERSHKLRKRVKDLRYQLEFLDSGQPKLGRLVRGLHHLTDLLGDRNGSGGTERPTFRGGAGNVRRAYRGLVEPTSEPTSGPASGPASRVEAPHGPGRGRSPRPLCPGEQEPIVQPVQASLPEFDALRDEAVSSPKQRKRHLLALEALLHLLCLSL